MKSIVTIILFFLFSSSVIAQEQSQQCDIHTHAQIYYIAGLQYLHQDLITQSDCPLKIQSQFARVILQFNETLPSHYIQTILLKEFSNYRIHIHPERIRVSALSSLLADQLDLPDNLQWKKIKQLNGKNILLLKKHESIVAKCDNCHTVGTKNIEITISHPLKNSKRKEWLQGLLAQATSVLMLKKSLGVNGQPLKLEQFQTTEILTATPEEFFSNPNEMMFYKLNKPKPTNSLLKRSDVMPMTLVKRGVPSRVTLSNKQITLTGNAIPIMPGKYGEIIQLRNPVSRKIILGKVVNFNKVLVEL